MTWMNEYEVEGVVDRFTEETPNLRRGARILSRLVDWTNNNSDGWPYWQKPSNAASKLMDHLEAARRDYDAADITEAQLNKTLTPIKTFLTKQGVDHALILDDPYEQKKMSDEQLRAWIADTVTVCMDEAVVRFEGARRNQKLTPAAIRVLIATSDIPQYLRTMLAGRYSEKYEVG